MIQVKEMGGRVGNNGHLSYPDGRLHLWRNLGYDITGLAHTLDLSSPMNGAESHHPQYEASFTSDLVGRGDIAVVLHGRQVINPLNGHDTSLPEAALKVFYPRPGMSRAHSKLKELFESESNTLNQVNHPHIAKFIGRKKLQLPVTHEVTATENNALFDTIVREWFPDTAADFVDGENRLEASEVVTMTEQIADAIDYLHREHNLIALDISPENIGRRNSNDFALTDLNLMAGEGESRDVFEGRAEFEGDFQAPELQTTGTSVIVSEAIPMYELGMVVNALLGGKVPSREERGLSQDELFTPIEGISQQVNEVLAKATRRDPKERYQSMKKFAAELKVAFTPNPTPEPIPESLEPVPA